MRGWPGSGTTWEVGEVEEGEAEVEGKAEVGEEGKAGDLYDIIYLDVPPASDVLPITKVGAHHYEASLA